MITKDEYEYLIKEIENYDSRIMLNGQFICKHTALALCEEYEESEEV